VAGFLPAGLTPILRRLLIALALLAPAAGAAQPVEEEEVVEEGAPEEGEEELGEVPMVKPPAEPPARPLTLRLGSSLAWDSNIFRSPQARSETVSSGYAGVRVDQPYAQQRFRLDLTGTAYRYANFGHLDFNALNYLGAWDWQVTPRVGGALTASRTQSLVDYSEFRNPGQRNVRTTENYAATADARLFGGWHVTGGLTQERNRYSVPFPQEGSYRASGGEAGLKWVARSTNRLAFNLRSLEGRYLDRPLDPALLLDDGFRRREAEGLVSWRMTGKSSLEGRLAHIDYRSNHFAERDFSGIAARLRYLWEAMAKLSYDLQFQRDISPWADVSASHRLEHRLAAAAIWQATAHVMLRLEARRGQSEFRDPLPGFAASGRRDTESALHFQAEWRALRNVTLNAGAQRYRQSSSDPAGNFSGRQLSAGAALSF
jgi:exopolysaccharide biosynthesis operon protein EpsL